MRIASGVAVAVLMATGALYAQTEPKLVEFRDRAIRAFQDSPSLGRFSDAGIAIMNASGWIDWINGPNWHQSDLPPRHPEFEKMKATLANGIMVSTSAIQAQGEFSDPTGRVTLAMLPAIRPSFFPNNQSVFAIALRPFKLVDDDIVTVIDALSAINRLTMRIRTAGPISYGTGGGPNGSWDVASIEARFDQEALVHGVMSDGRSTGYRVRSVMTTIGERNCTDRGGSVIGTRVTPDWDSSIVAWIGKPAPGNATVATRQTGRGTAMLVTETVDLDRDNVPDFSIWAGTEPPTIGDTPIPWKVVFVNIGGTWLLGSYRVAPECT